jgi:predicted transcriptional regulator
VPPHFHNLSRRERQIMDVIYRFGKATVKDVLDGIPDPPEYNSIRTHLRILEDKGYVQHIREGHAYVYFPVIQQKTARKNALRNVLTTFFEGSPARLLTSLIDETSARMSDDEWDALRHKIDELKKRKKK